MTNLYTIKQMMNQQRSWRWAGSSERYPQGRLRGEGNPVPISENFRTSGFKPNKADCSSLSSDPGKCDPDNTDRCFNLDGSLDVWSRELKPFCEDRGQAYIGDRDPNAARAIYGVCTKDKCKWEKCCEDVQTPEPTSPPGRPLYDRANSCKLWQNNLTGSSYYENPEFLENSGLTSLDGCGELNVANCAEDTVKWCFPGNQDCEQNLYYTEQECQGNPACENKLTDTMIDYGLTCGEYLDKDMYDPQTKCASDWWINNKYCEQECVERGFRYNDCAVYSNT